MSVPEQSGERSPDRPAGQAEQSNGRVYLVGAGPGDPGLLTARALELIVQADTILYDRLIPAQALDGARGDAELLYVGKEGGGEAVPQEQTQALLVARAGEGKQVVRLKGGDPFVFGRGGEEALALREAGIAYEVVPGVTAGVAAAAYAGIPVTHRGVASAVALVTGHTQTGIPRDGAQAGEDPEKPETALDWAALAAFPGTLVFYMGIRQLPHIAQSLIAGGRPAEEPAAVIERGTLPAQRTVTATLATIAQHASEAGIKPPSITVVGPVAALGEEMAWRSPGPLSGRTVAVTRARAQASGLARRLGELGASVIEAPAIRIEPLPGEPLDPSPYDLLCLTSPNGVQYLLSACKPAGAIPVPSLTRAWPLSAQGRHARCASTASWPTSSPSVSWPSRLYKRCRTCRSSAPLWLVPRRRAKCFRKHCAREAPRSMCWRSMRRSPSRCRSARLRRRARRTTSPSPPLQRCASSCRPPARIRSCRRGHASCRSVP